MLFALAVLFIGCKNQNEDDILSFRQFYDDLLMYEEHLRGIIQESQTSETSHIQKRNFSDSNDISEWLVTIQRTEALDIYNQSTMNQVHDRYYQYLLETESLVQTIKDAIEGHEDIALNEPFTPTTLENTTYTFMRSEEGYILIDAFVDSQHTFLKLGLNDDLLDYQQFTYYYDIEGYKPGTDITMNFHYFTFLENKKAVHVTYSEHNSSLSYNNIETDEEFTISYGSEMIESSSTATGYTLNRFDKVNNTHTYLEVVNDQIITKTYDVFDEHGQVYRYEDINTMNDEIEVAINFVTATGWDYVVASDASSTEIDAVTGIYLADGTKIYGGRIGHTLTPNHAYLSLKIPLEHKALLSDDIFSLNAYGLDLDHPKASLAFFESIDLEYFSEIKDTFKIENLNFFASNLHHELYAYVDSDIRAILDGTDNPEEPVVATGDVEAYEEALRQFNENLSNNPYYVTSALTRVKLIDSNDNLISSSRTNDYLVYNLNELFFSHVQTNEQGQTQGYYIDGTKGNLVTYEQEGLTVKYNILDQSSNRDNFTQAYESYLDEPEENIISHINKIDDYTFELTVLANRIKISGVSIVDLYEQQGIFGLDGTEIIIRQAFDLRYSAYTESYKAVNLTSTINHQTYTVEITSSQTLSIATSEITSPQDQESLMFYLSKDRYQSLFTKGIHQDRYALDQGFQYLHLYLEPGEYSIDINADHTETLFHVYDVMGNLMTYDKRFEVTTEGLYILEIYSNAVQGAVLNVYSNPESELVYFDLGTADGILEDSVNQDGSHFYWITLPATENERLLIIDPYFIGEPIYMFSMSLNLEISSISYTDHCIFDEYAEVQKTCYFYIPANTELTMSLTGWYQGQFGMNYRYWSIPEVNGDYIIQMNDLSSLPLIWLSTEVKQAKVQFTITEAGNYLLNTYFKNYKHSYHDASLYDANNNQLRSDWFQTIYLEPGDYYILYHITSNTVNIKTLIIPTITKQ